MIAVIFDMDGVISDTQMIWSEVQAAAMRRHGADITTEQVSKIYSGVPSDIMFNEIIPGVDQAPLLEEVFLEMGRRLKKHVPEIPGAIESIERIQKEGFPLAIGSGSPLHIIETILDSLKIRASFQVIASGYEVERGKPHPDVFLLAAKRLGVSPTSCVVIEDGHAGIIAARAAGMRVVAFNAPDAEADAHIDDMRQFTPELVRSLVGR